MKLQEIDAKSFDEIAKLEPLVTIFQSSYWAKYKTATNNKSQVLYLNYLNDKGISCGLAMFLLKKVSLFKYEAYSSFGFLFNYYDKELLQIFCKDLISYLQKKKVNSIIIEPFIYYQNKKYNNDPIIEALQEVGFKKTADSFIYHNKLDNTDELSAVFETVRFNHDDHSQFSSFVNNPDYDLLYESLYPYSKLLAVKLNVPSSRRMINDTISNLRHQQDNNFDENREKLISEKKNLLQKLNDYQDNPILCAVCLVNYGKRLFEVINICKENDPFGARKAMANIIKEEAKNLGYHYYDSLSNTNNGDEIELLGEFTYNK